MTDNFEHALEKENQRLAAESEHRLQWAKMATMERNGAMAEMKRLRTEVERLTRERDEARKEWRICQDGMESAQAERDEWKARAERAEEELRRVQGLPEMEWARASSVIAQGLALHARADQPAAKRMLEALDQAKTYVGRLKARAEAAEARSWVQCTTVSNECLGGCRSMKEHEAYVHGILIAELESLRPMVALHEDMTRLKREADVRAEVAEADNATLHERIALIERELYLEHFETAHRMAGDLVREQHPGAALLALHDAVRQYQHRDEPDTLATFRRLMEERGRYAERIPANDHQAVLERLRAAEKAVEAAREHLADNRTVEMVALGEALAAYDAAKEGK